MTKQNYISIFAHYVQYVCMYVRVYIHTYVCTNVQYVCMYECMHVCTCVYMYTHTERDTHTHTLTHTPGQWRGGGGDARAHAAWSSQALLARTSPGPRPPLRAALDPVHARPPPMCVHVCVCVCVSTLYNILNIYFMYNRVGGRVAPWRRPQRGGGTWSGTP